MAARISGWKFKHDGTVLRKEHRPKHERQECRGRSAAISIAAGGKSRSEFHRRIPESLQNGTAYTVRSYGASRSTTRIANGPTVQAYDQSLGIYASPTNRTADDPGNGQPFFDHGNTSAWTFQGDYSIPGSGVVTSVLSYRANNLNQNGAAYPTSYPFPFQGSQTENMDFGHFHQFTGELRYASPACLTGGDGFVTP